MRRRPHGPIRKERLFLLLFIPLVLGMMLVMPVGGPPDEQAHLRQAWLLSTGQTGSDTAVFPANLRGFLGTSEGTTEGNALRGEAFRTARLSEETVTEKGNEATGIYPLAAYLPQSLAMFLARLFTDRIMLLLYSARIGSMIVTGLLFYLAIRRSPVGKNTILAIACLPLTLQEAASASCDGMTIAGICWIVSEMLRRIRKEDGHSVRLSVRFAGIGICTVLFKLFYAPVLLLGTMPYAVTAEEKKQKRRENLVLAAAFLLAIAAWYLLSVSHLSGRQGLTAGALNRLGEVAADPLKLFAIQFRTLAERAPGWIRQLFGVFGRLDVFSPWTLTVLLGISFLCVALADDGIGALLPDRKQARRLRILMIVIFFLCWMLLSCSLLIWWTPEGETLITGIQGRYFLPCLLCLLLCLPELLGKMSHPAERREKIRAGALAVYLVCSAVTVILLSAEI